jgi:RNA polymerase sigma-70 factor (sigma-E family)
VAEQPGRSLGDAFPAARDVLWESVNGEGAQVTFEEFVAMRLSALLRYAAVLTGDRELAQDVVQDALVQAFRRWSRIVALEQPEWFVKKMITRQFLSWQRRTARRAGLLAARAPDRELTVPDHAGLVASRDEVRQRLAGLPKRQRAVLVLRYYEGLTDTETAELLGCSAGAVRTCHARAIAALRLSAEVKPLLKEAR